MELKNKKIFNSFLSIILIFAIIIAVFGFYRDVKNTFEYGGIDLRPRVVGARLLLKNIDPYTFKWSQEKSDLLLDPKDQPDKPVSRVVSIPTVLAIHSIMANLNYKYQRIGWFLLQWIFFILSILMFSKCTNSNTKSKIIWIIGLLFISSSSSWRLHVERGQNYILYVFIFTLAYWLSIKKFKHNDILSGFFIGYAISLRPTYIFMSIPILIYKKWKLLIGTIIGFLSGLGSSLLVVDISVWKGYFSAMKFFGEHPHSFGDTWGNTYYDIYPNRIIEGMNNLAKGVDLPTHDSSIQGIFANYLGINLSTNILIIFLVLIMIVVLIFLFRFKIKNISISMLFLLGAVLVFVSGFFIPAARYPYYNIFWLVPLSLIVINAKPFVSILNFRIIFFFIGIFVSISIPFAPGGMLMSDFAMFIYIVVATLFIFKKELNNKNKADIKLIL